MQEKIISGPSLKCYINGDLLGIVTNFRFTVRTSHIPLRGIDVNTVQEFAPSTYTVLGSIEVVRTRGSGGLEGAGIVPFSDTILLEKYLRIDLLDRVTDKVVFSAINGVVTEQSWQTGPKSLMTGAFSFEATDFTNEAG